MRLLYILGLAILVSLLIACGTDADFSTGIYEKPPVKYTHTQNPGKANVITDKKYLVLVSIDACRPDYFDFSDIPNIRKLMAQGSSYQNAWVGQLRNNTPPGHATMSTGAFPKNNGILCFFWKEPATGRFTNLSKWDTITTGEVSRIVSGSGSFSIGSLYKKAYPDAKVAAVSSDKFYAAAALAAEGADYIVFDHNPNPLDAATIGAVEYSLSGVGGKLAPESIMNDASFNRRKVNRYDGDSWATDVALKLFEKERPEIMLINLPETDHSGHESGGITSPILMKQVIDNVDRQIGRLVEAYKTAGIYDKTIFTITADHGMAPLYKPVKPQDLTNAIRKGGTKVLFDSTEPYLADPTMAAAVAESIATSGISEIYGAYYLSKGLDGSYSYLPSPATENNITGDLDACYRYLSSTYASAKSPDVIIIFAENTRNSNYPGRHDTVTWANQHIPLIISGPGVRQGVNLESPARLVDIAPTMLTLLGIKPEKMDGIVLADALVAPQSEFVEKQRVTTEHLAPLSRALKIRSEMDISKQK